MSQASSVLSDPAISQGVVAGIKWAFAAIGVGVAYPASKAVWQVARTWGDLLSRISRIEYILTGDEGVNGVRGDVKTAREEVQEVKTALIEQGQKTHTALGNVGIRVERIDDRVTLIEERTAKTPRRKSTGRRSIDR